jgi:hypothetical protein
MLEAMTAAPAVVRNDRLDILATNHAPQMLASWAATQHTAQRSEPSATVN